MLTSGNNYEFNELRKKISEAHNLVKNMRYFEAIKLIVHLENELKNNAAYFSFNADINNIASPILHELQHRIAVIRELIEKQRFDEAQKQLDKLQPLDYDVSTSEIFRRFDEELRDLYNQLRRELARYEAGISSLKQTEQLFIENRLDDAQYRLEELDTMFSGDYPLPLRRGIELLRNKINLAIAEKNAGITTITLKIEHEESKTSLIETRLTPYYLESNFLPYFKAVAELQHIINEIRGQKLSDIAIKAFSQNSPISLSMDGAADAIEVMRETVVPWRRKHAEEMARLEEVDKQVDIAFKKAELESKKAEVLEQRAKAQKDRAEAEKLRADSVKQREEAEKIRLENENLRLELYRARINLAIDLLRKIAPNVSETEKIAYVVKLLPPLETLVLSELNLG